MFGVLPLLSIALAASSSVSAAAIPKRATPPPGWLTDVLEPYNVYHTRYLALSCQDKHNTEFFDSCCHPMLATETLEKNRAPICAPSASASASASAAEPTSTVVPDEEPDCEDDEDDDDDDEDCEDDDSTTSAAAPTTKAAAPATTHVASTPAAAHTSSAVANVGSDPSPTTTPPKATTPKATPSKTAEAKPTATKSSSSSTVSGGFATFFDQNGVAGACGKVHSDGELIAAIDSRRYGNTGAVSSLCGKQVVITNTANQKSVTVTIADACPTCENSNSIDLSRGAFDKIAAESTGIVPIEWHFA